MPHSDAPARRRRRLARRAPRRRRRRRRRRARPERAHARAHPRLAPARARLAAAGRRRRRGRRAREGGRAAPAPARHHRRTSGSCSSTAATASARCRPRRWRSSRVIRASRSCSAASPRGRASSPRAPVELEPVREASLEPNPRALPTRQELASRLDDPVADDPRRAPRGGVHGQARQRRAIRGRGTSPARGASRSTTLFAAGRRPAARRSRSASSSARPREPRSSRTATPARAPRSRRSRCARRLRRAQLRRLVARVEPAPRAAARALGSAARARARRRRGTRRRASARARSSAPIFCGVSARSRVGIGRRIRVVGDPALELRRVTSGWNCTPQHASPRRNACVHAALRASSTAPAGSAVRVVVPLQRLERPRQRAEHGIVDAVVGQLDVAPADLRARPACARPTRPPRARAAARRGRRRAPACAGASSCCSHIVSSREPRDGARPGRRASRRRTRAPRRSESSGRGGGVPQREAPLVERVPAPRRSPARRAPSARRCRGSPRGRARRGLYASPPVAGIRFTSSSRRSWCAFAAACEMRPSGFSGSSERRVVVEERERPLRLPRELLQRRHQLLELLVGVEIVEALRRRAAALVPRAEVAAVEADVRRRRRHRGHRRDEVLRRVGLRRVDGDVRRADVARGTTSVSARFSSSSHERWRNSTSISSPPSCSRAHSR